MSEVVQFLQMPCCALNCDQPGTYRIALIDKYENPGGYKYFCDVHVPQIESANSSPPATGEVTEEMVNQAIKAFNKEWRSTEILLSATDRSSMRAALQSARLPAAEQWRPTFYVIEHPERGYFKVSGWSRWEAQQMLTVDLAKERWTKNIHAALHFARAQDGKEFLHFEGFAPGCKIVEHAYVTPPQAADVKEG